MGASAESCSMLGCFSGIMLDAWVLQWNARCLGASVESCSMLGCFSGMLDAWVFQWNARCLGASVECLMLGCGAPRPDIGTKQPTHTPALTLKTSYSGGMASLRHTSMLGGHLCRYTQQSVWAPFTCNSLKLFVSVRLVVARYCPTTIAIQNTNREAILSLFAASWDVIIYLAVASHCCLSL